MIKKIWVNGCFDILHEGHLDLLQYASGFGDLYVGIDSDNRVRQLKGESRPINSQEFRYRMISSLKFVKECYVFDSDTELETIIHLIYPEIMIVGEDYRNKPVIGYNQYSKLLFYPHRKGYSTTNFIEKLKG